MFFVNLQFVFVQASVVSFTPGSKLAFSTNLFHHSLLAPTWTAFSDYTGPDLLC